MDIELEEKRLSIRERKLALKERREKLKLEKIELNLQKSETLRLALVSEYNIGEDKYTTIFDKKEFDELIKKYYEILKSL